MIDFIPNVAYRLSENQAFCRIGVELTEVAAFAAENPELFAAQVRAARGLLGWSQGYLADGLGVSRSTIADIEANKRAPHPATLFILITELTAAGIIFTDLGVEFEVFPPPAYVPTGLRGRSAK
jgi:DNA-binding XRE family transcriptional regulator